MASDKQTKAPNAGARREVKPTQPDLWSKIVTVAEAKDISYREATEIAVKEYWLEHKLDKKP
jgi:lysozyme family protein